MTGSRRRIVVAGLALCATLTFVAERNARAAPHYKRLCDPSRSRHCHMWVLADDNEEPITSPAPPQGAFGATDLQAAYHRPKTGGNSRIIATEIGSAHYVNAESDLAV